MEMKLERIAKVARTNPNEKFTSLIHLINKEAFIQCHNDTKVNKASGADEITNAMYEKNLVENIE